MRRLDSYAKVQHVIGAFRRNRSFQLTRATLARSYIDVGCGYNFHPGFIHLDYCWKPHVDVCWDINRGLPFADGSFRGVFSEHCLEHFSLPRARALLREFRRVLAPGGTLRLVVPDAESYLRTYVDQLDGGRARQFPFQTLEETEPTWTPLMSVNRVFYQDRESPAGHCTMFDFQLMHRLLTEAGFVDVRRQAFGQGRDPQLIVDSPDHAAESLYVDALAPLK